MSTKTTLAVLAAALTLGLGVAGAQARPDHEPVRPPEMQSFTAAQAAAESGIAANAAAAAQLQAGYTDVNVH